MQSDGVLSTSHAANSFIETGLFMLAKRSNRVGFSVNTFDMILIDNYTFLPFFLKLLLESVSLSFFVFSLFLYFFFHSLASYVYVQY